MKTFERTFEDYLKKYGITSSSNLVAGFMAAEEMLNDLASEIEQLKEELKQLKTK